MKIYVFGNPDLDVDTAALRLVPYLKKKFADCEFVIQDPNEEWDIPEKFFVIDVVHGIKEVRLFDGIEEFSEVPRVSMHDFDALTNIRFMAKLGKIKDIKIIGVPPSIPHGKACDSVSTILLSNLPSKSAKHSSYTDRKPE